MKRKFFRVIAHYLPQCLLLISILTSNVLFPASVIAQEIENTNNVTQEETVPIDTSEDILEEGISTSIFEETEAETEIETEKEIIEEEEVVEPLFVFENGIYTVNTVVEGEEYVYPDNNDVRVKFTEVTQEGNLVINRVELTEEQISKIKRTTYIIAIGSNNEIKVYKIDPELISERNSIISETISKITWHNSTNKWDYSKEYYEGDGSEILE